MPDATNSVILTEVQKLTGPTTGSDILPALAQVLPDALKEASRQLDALRLVSAGQADAISANTDAVTLNTMNQGSGGQGVVHTIGNIASQLFGGTLGAMPLVSGIAKLFGGGSSSEAPPPLVQYSLPPAVNLEASTGYAHVTLGQDGLPRASASAAGRTATAPASTQITVQVQAMDSRSFLDHSDDIARAVRQAMLNTNPLNDVVSEI